jgi:hypothetical protein
VYMVCPMPMTCHSFLSNTGGTSLTQFNGEKAEKNGEDRHAVFMKHNFPPRCSA